MRRIMTLIAGGVCVGILCVMIFFHMQGIQVLAMTENLSESPIEGKKIGSVILEYGREKPIQHAGFSIFQVAEKIQVSEKIQVAEKTENGSYRKTGNFETCPVQIELEDVSRWRETAETLEIYVLRDRLTPLRKGETDLNGRLKFENLGAGVYLIVGEKKIEGKKTYIPEPILLVLARDGKLPENKASEKVASGNEKSENGKSENMDEGGAYQVTVHPKYREEEKARSSNRDHDDASETIRVRAIKVWEEEKTRAYPEIRQQDIQAHPTQVTVQLLRDGVFMENAVLSEDNQWSCMWENLDADRVWKVAEEVPEGYVVSIRQEGETFLLTNRKENRYLPGESETSVEEPDLPDAEKLPQTGSSWYLVLILGAIGILLVRCCGKIEKRRKADDGKKERKREKTEEKAGEKKWRSIWVWMLRIFGTCCMILAGIFAGKNSSDEIRAYNHVKESQRKLEVEEQAKKKQEQPLYLLDPARVMPEKVVDGKAYIGVLEIPSLGRELPVMSEWTDERLKQAPCRYAGSAYLQNLVIAGHNYRAHFSGIGNLKKGDSVIFTDMDGNRFFYEVTEIEILNAEETERMTESWWALTLFTCTVGGGRRIAVRCDALVQDE